MKPIRILSESAVLGSRLRDILYQAGYSDLTAAAQIEPEACLQKHSDGLLIIYAKTQIPEIIRSAACSGDKVILLLDPNSYAQYLERARDAGITPLLMPVAPFILLDAVQRAIS